MSVAKTPATESFPVAMRLLGADIRPAVLAFYRFARTADDIADSAALDRDAKLAQLGELEQELLAPSPRHPLAAALVAVDREHGTGIGEARLLLAAFRQDAVRQSYAAWDDLLEYCRLSAVPVGRFLLRLHGSGTAAEAPADALCIALQLLNHLQDMGADRERLERVYLPRPWLDAAGGEARFFDPAATKERRAVLDAALDQIDGLLATAHDLPSHLPKSGIGRQAAVTLACGRLLSRRLRRSDPLAGRVTVGTFDKALLAARVLLPSRPYVDPAWTREVVARSGSSFQLGMRCLSGDRRRALYAIYAYCRTIDDLADGAAPPDERRRFLMRWRDELSLLDERPTTPVGRELAWACRRFSLPQAELHLLLDGMIADAAARVRLADDAALERYCRAVAGSVGVLAVRIFGADDADAFAFSLARAFQYVNVLRDVEEDAGRDRMYLPRTLLDAHGVPDADAGTMIEHPGFARAWTRLADDAEAAFAGAEALLATQDRRPLRPAIVMLWSYRPLLQRLVSRGWRPHSPRPRLTRGDKLRLTLRAMAAT